MAGHATDSSLLTSSAVLFSRLSDIGRLSQMISESNQTSAELARNARNYYYSVINMHVLLVPHLLPEDEDKIDELIEEYNAVYLEIEAPRGKTGIKRNQSLGTSLTIDLANKILKVLVRRMGASGMYSEGMASGTAEFEEGDGEAAAEGDPE